MTTVASKESSTTSSTSTGSDRGSDSVSRRGSESDHEKAIQYEDCTGAAYRIRKGVPKTPLQVSQSSLECC